MVSTSYWIKQLVALLHDMNEPQVSFTVSKLASAPLLGPSAPLPAVRSTIVRCAIERTDVEGISRCRTGRNDISAREGGESESGGEGASEHFERMGVGDETRE